jgi:formylglycine-generating enzyme required for sulfatase activity
VERHVVELDDEVVLELQWVPPGEFLMGSLAAEEGHEAGESPRHPVQLARGFWMGKYVISQLQWQAIMGFNPSNFVEPRQPVEMVSWRDVEEFIKSLNNLSRAVFALPTEAQWEYACRGGTTTRFSTGDTEADLAAAAWYAQNSGGRPHPVGEREPNSLGLYDMHGNVFEWAGDWFGPYPSGPVVDPAGPSHGERRVLRGGCCLCSPENCRAANRYDKAPDGKNYNIGFRVVMLA